MYITSQSSDQALKVFISYSHADLEYLVYLKKHLAVLEKQKFIEIWDDRRITGGEDWEKEINKNINQADVILLLVSADFMGSAYCYGTEMVIALQRESLNEANVIPIILRDVDWESSPLGRLKALPIDGKPIKKYENSDAAYKEIAREIRQIVGKRRVSRATNISGADRPEKASPRPVQFRVKKQKIFRNNGKGKSNGLKTHLESSINIPALVQLEKHRDSFGGWEILYAFIFGAFLSGINLIQRISIFGEGSGPNIDFKQVVVLNVSMGVSAFFLTAAMLLFLSHESEKISLFIKGVSRNIVLLYLVAIGFIEVISHFDSFKFSARPIILLVLSHSMFFVVGLIETIIDLNIAMCFNKISNHYSGHARIYKKAGLYALISVIGNFVLAFIAILVYAFKRKTTDDVWTLSLMGALNLYFLIDIRRKIKSLE